MDQVYPNIYYTSDNLNHYINHSDEAPAIIIFSAHWSSYSTIIEVVAKKVSDSLKDSALFILDADTEKNILTKYKISNVPSCIVIYQNEIIGRFSGLFSKKDIIDSLKNLSRTHFI